MEVALLDALLYQTEMGKRAESGYKKGAWEYTKTEVQRVGGPTKAVSNAHCKSKLDSFKKEWKIWVKLAGISGFSLTANGIVSQDPAALVAYFQAHNEARRFQYRSIKYEDQLCQLFEVVPETGRDAVSMEEIVRRQREEDELAELVERPPSVSASTADERPAPVLRRKRSGTASLDRARGKQKKKNTATDRLGRELGKITQQLEALIATTIGIDYQRDAIKSFTGDFEILHPTLQLAVVEAFQHEPSAKTYMFLGPYPDLRKLWVESELLKRREALAGGDYDGLDFDGVMNSVEWSGDCVLGKKVVVETVVEEDRTGG